MIRSQLAPSRVCLALLVVASAACGGGGGGVTNPPPVTQPTPTPAPQPTPTPTPTTDPDCTQGLCEPATTNTNPVVLAQLRLYQLFDDEGIWVQPTPDPVQQVVREPIPVGYTIRLDLVGRDSANKDTLGKKQIEFYYRPEDMVQVSIQSDFQRKLKVLKEGSFTVHAVFDGVGSNDLRFTFVAKK
jgi:hypothetical protein